MTNVITNNQEVMVSVTAPAVQETIEDVKKLKNTVHHLSNSINHIISKAVENNIKDVIIYSKELNNVLIDSINNDVTKETVIRCQDILSNVISTIIYGYLPKHWGEIPLWSEQKQMIELICIHKKLVVALDPNVCDGHFGLECDFRDWTFMLKTYSDLLTLKTHKDTPKMYVPNINDWYYCYGGRKQIYDCVSQKNCDLFISEQGTIHRNVVDGFVADTLRGWDFNTETLNQLINILDNDSYDVDFDDTQTAIHIKGINLIAECEGDDYE